MHASGDIRWRRGRVFVSEALEGELVGVTDRGDASLLVRFIDIDLGVIDRERLWRINPVHSVGHHPG